VQKIRVCKGGYLGEKKYGQKGEKFKVYMKPLRNLAFLGCKGKIETLLRK
jgi:hypothetical protein